MAKQLGKGEIYQLGNTLGYADQKLLDFVKEIEDDQRASRKEERDLKRQEEKDAGDVELQRQKDLMEFQETQRRTREEEEETKRTQRIEEQEAAAEKEFQRQKDLFDLQKEQKEVEMRHEREIQEKREEEKKMIEEANKLKVRELNLKEKEMKDKAEYKPMAKAPRLPLWQEKEDMDSYLTRFEIFAKINWKPEHWCTNLSALLTGKALEVYYRMPIDENQSYEKLKEALLRNFQLTEEGFRKKLYNCKAENSETAVQFFTRLQGYFDRWLALAKCPLTFEGLRDFLVRTFFFSSCHVSIATHLKEFEGITNKQLISKADIYLQAHGIANLSSSSATATKPSNSSNDSGNFNSRNRNNNNQPSVICTYCKSRGHKTSECKFKKENKAVVCTYCKRPGHIRPSCLQLARDEGQGKNVNSNTSNSAPHHSVKCYHCGKEGHIARNCTGDKQSAAAVVQVNEVEEADVGEKSTTKCNSRCCGECRQAACFITDIKTNQPVDELKEIQRDGKRLLVCSKDCPAPIKIINCRNLPTAECILNDQEAILMRDSGCTGVVVHQKFVKPEDYTGHNKLVLMVDGSVKTVPVAKVKIDSPYYQGVIDAMVMKTPIYDLIIGNIENVRNVSDPNISWRKPCMKCVTTQKAKQPVEGIVTPSKQVVETNTIESVKINASTDTKEEETLVQETQDMCMSVKTRAMVEKEKIPKKELIVEDIHYQTEKQKSFSLEQQKDPTLKKLWSCLEDGKSNIKKTKEGRTWFEVVNNILYRRYECPRKEHLNKTQVILPEWKRQECMKLAHSAILGGHMGVMKTLNRITNKFYWTGIQGDVMRFCQSCDICQRTIPKGMVGHVPLDEMPKIDVPFKRIAVDIVGPIKPPSDSGHRYILTMIDYATRYPEAIPLKTIDTISVAEAMLEMYSRVGFPEEVLSDRGSNFTSDMMKEISRLISVRRLTTTPYHPMCNGLCERFNGVLKTILRKLTSERPKDWHRYLPAVLFAYREVPNESTGFSPFELLYGRDVRGPMSILKEVWLKEQSNEEKKDVYQYVLDLRERIEGTCKTAREELEKSARRYKRYYDRTAKSRILQENEEVLLLLPTDTSKLLVQWKGPYKVVERTGKYTYKIQMPGNTKVFHINMLKQYFRPKTVTEGQDSNLEPDQEDVEVTAATMIIHESEDEDIDLIIPGGPSENYRDIQYSPHLSSQQLKEAKDLVQEYQDIFTDKPGSTTMEEHKIELTTEEPVKQRPYPLPYSMREIVKKEVDQMWKDGIIERTDSAYASPIVMVKKPDGTYRLCIDYRKLNRITIFDGEPMPSMVDIFSGLVNDKLFSKFDLSKGFWQIPVRKTDRPKTAFVTQDGVFQFRKMPFGAINSTATFNRLMRKVYGSIMNVDCFVDDMLVHDQTWEVHLESLRRVFEATKQAGLTIRPKKSQIAFDNLDFLGHTIGKGIISPQEEKIKKILDTPPPQTKKQVRMFMGLIGYYRSFIPHFATLAAPITDLTKNSAPNKVVWNMELQYAFDKLKCLITQEPILKIPDFDRKFFLQTDASDLGVGAVLLQEYDGIKYPLAFYSRKFLEQHKRYSIIEKECLAIIWSVQKFEIYLYGRDFVLETDHQALTFIDQVRINNNRVMRWSLFLQNYRFQILSIKGKDNVIADYLSRTIT